MIKNNKGVTLVELLIVIVVMGIIAAFSIPAVGTIIENTTKDNILNDAMQIENAAKLHCSGATPACTSSQTLTWAVLEPYVEGLDTTYYDLGVAGAAIVATYDGTDWGVDLEGAGTDAASWDWEFTAGLTPSDSDRSDVVTDGD